MYMLSLFLSLSLSVSVSLSLSCGSHGLLILELQFPLRKDVSILIEFRNIPSTEMDFMSHSLLYAVLRMWMSET
jgi:hypothetical protein